MSKNVLLAITTFLIGTTSLLNPPAVQADDAAGTITLVNAVPYTPDNEIRKNILNECTTLGEKLSSFTQSYSKKKSVTVELVDGVDIAGPGRILAMEITDAVSSGNAFIGHRKFVGIRGTLWENGEKIASFDGQRGSGGGMWAQYKSSCAVLGRCVKRLGKDVAEWLENPEDDAELGD